MCSLNKTLNNDFDIISLKIMKNLKDPINERRSVVMRANNKLFNGVNNYKFQFVYQVSSKNRPLIKGFRNDMANKDKAEIKTLDYFSHKMRSNIVDFTLIKNRNFGQGIRTYRLYG